MDYFIADTHFGDENIILFEDRPYKTVEIMNRSLIENWNSTVTNNDTVYVIGDFAIGVIEDDILNQLNGKKILVKGNHDEKSNQRYRELGFDEVYDKPVIYENWFILSHEPLYMNERMPYVNIFGHVHNSPLYTNFSKNHYCVCVERTGFKPISFKDIKDTIQNISKLSE